MNTRITSLTACLRRGGEGVLLHFTALLLVLFAGPAHGQTIDAKFWTVNDFGSVGSIVRAGNTIYLAGGFTEVGPCTGQGVPVSAETGAPAPAYPTIGGEVDAVISDGQAGWFIGGGFISAAGTTRHFLGRVLADGSLSSWAPEPDGVVSALCLRNDTLYVG